MSDEMTPEEKKKHQQRGLTPFKKGDPNNPAKLNPEDTGEAKAHKGLRHEARKYRDLAIQTLVEVCKQDKNLGARVDAAQELLTRGYGRPHVQSEGKERAPTTKINVNFGDSVISTDALQGRNNGTLAPFVKGYDPRRPHNHPNLTINGEAVEDIAFAAASELEAEDMEDGEQH